MEKWPSVRTHQIFSDKSIGLFLSAIFFASAIGVLVTATSHRQSVQDNPGRKLKTIDFKDMPLKLSEVRGLDSDTWYNDLEIELKNTSKKPIYGVLAYLQFPDVPVPADGIYGIPLLWTSSTSTAKWLVFDRNRNGTIDNGKELFGNFTFQTEPPAGVEKNGFLALAEYDKPENGGNGDGMIDSRDAVFSKIRLWQDVNHNGISESNELHLLSDFSIEAISLDYKESRRHDRFGNQFRYRAKLYGPQHRELSHWAWDVFLLSAK